MEFQKKRRKTLPVWSIATTGFRCLYLSHTQNGKSSSLETLDSRPKIQIGGGGERRAVAEHDEVGSSG
jgi:hypothetical protein